LGQGGCGGEGRGKRTKDSSFSEEKEAKRLLCLELLQVNIVNTQSEAAGK
jgi:hypothetical protein